MYVTTFLY